MQTYTNIKTGFFNFFTITMFSSVISSSAFVRIWPTNSYFILLIIMIITLVLLLLFPNFKRPIMKNIMETKVLRIILLLYFLGAFLYTSLICVDIFCTFFYFETPNYIFLIIFIFVAFYFSRFSFKGIFEIGFFLFLAIIAVNLLQYLNVQNMQIDHLIHDMFIFNNDYSFLLFAFFYLDGIIYTFISVDKQIAISKKSLIISTVCALIFSSYLLLHNYFDYSSELLKITNYPGIIRYKNSIGPRYIEHFDILLVINTSVFLVIRGALNLKLFRIFLKSKQKDVNIFGLSIFTAAIGVLIQQFIVMTEKITFYAGVLCSLMLLFVYVYIMIKRRKWNAKTNEST